MLNTKPIKKKNQYSYDNHTLNISSDSKPNVNHSDKIVNIQSSKQIELENMVKQANLDNVEQLEDINNNNNNNDHNNSLLMTDNQIKNPIVNKEFTNDTYKDKNLNVSNVITGGKLLNEYEEYKYGKGNNFIQHQYLPDDFNNNNNNNNNNNHNHNIITNNKVEWDNDDNCYVIYHNNEIDCRLTNEHILKSLLNQEHNDIYVKKYIFITSWNSQLENYEFNFINSPFTNNLDMTIKIQNFIYDTLMNFDNLNVSDTYNYHDTIMIFYFQLIIFLFNNYNFYLSLSDINKLSKIYSSLSYRFSSLVLKNILKIKNNIDENTNLLDKLILIRTDILSQVNFINEKINMDINTNIDYTDNFKSNIQQFSNTDVKLNTETNSESEYESINESNNNSDDNINNNFNNNNNFNDNNNSDDNSDNNSDNNNNNNNNNNDINDSDIYGLTNTNETNSSKSYKIINSRKLNKTNINSNISTNTNTNTNTNNLKKNKLEKMGIKNKYGNVVKNIRDVFVDDLKINTETSDNDKYDSDKNGYFEINDTVSGYTKLQNPNNYKKITPMENSFQSNNKSMSNKDLSYNPNSAILNGKIYKINI